MLVTRHVGSWDPPTWPQEEQEYPVGLFPLNFILPAKARGFWWLLQLSAHFCNCLLQKEKSKDFRKHVTKYLETLLNSQQQVSVPDAGSQPSFTSWSSM